MNSLHLIKISLLDIDPCIWRRFLVRSDTKLSSLHDAIQMVMGWEDCHLHNYEVGGEQLGPRGGPGGMSSSGRDESKFKLGDLVERGDRFRYTYDFGDDWRHELMVENVIKVPKSMGE